MEPLIYQFSTLSSTFAHGAYQVQNFNRPEVRAPSVKGMIRWWFDALVTNSRDALDIFGTIQGGNRASAVSFRVTPDSDPEIANTSFIPHKGSKGGTKSAIQPGVKYTLTLTPRRAGISKDQEEELVRATEAWLLLGSIGQRSNRAAGSILWDHAPNKEKEFCEKAKVLLRGSKISIAILNRSFSSEASARNLAGDFLSPKAFKNSAPFGSVEPRKSSPLKLKCIQLNGRLRLLAIWDHRKESAFDLESGVRILQASRKPIGTLLADALSQLTN